MLSSPPQGFTATAVLPSAVDGTTIASTGGVLSVPALVNMGSGVFSAYPLVLGMDTGESIPALTVTGATGVTFSTNNAGLVSSSGAKIEGAGAWSVYPAGTGNRAFNIFGLSGQTADYFAVIANGGTVQMGVNSSGQVYSNIATGTAPLSVASTTQVANLNAQLWGGAKNDIAEIAATGGYTTTSSTHVSTGQGGSFTPSSTKVEIVSSADIYNETAGEIAQVGIYRNTSGVPSSGTSVGSDTLVASASMVSGTASADATVALVALDTGLTAGTEYYYYWAVWVESSGTVGLQTLQGESLQTTRMLLRST